MQTKQLHVIPHALFPRLPTPALTPCPLQHQSVFQLLDTVGHTATGLDEIPFLRFAAPLISEPTAYIFNLSLSYSVVPTKWKSSSITLVPKVSQPKTGQDFRPISFTVVLSRLMKKEFIRLVIYPVFDHPQFKHLFQTSLLSGQLVRPLRH